MIAAWACRHSSLLAASFLACTIPPDLPHILGSSGGSSRRTPDPDRIASLRQRARGDTMSNSPAAGNTATGDTSNVPVTAARAFSTTDIPQKIGDIAITPGNLHLWPVGFDRTCEALGLFHRFVITRSTTCQQYITAEAKASDDAQEQVWMHAHGPWREKLEQAVYNLIKDLWKSFPEAEILFRQITPTTPRCADAIWAALLTEYPLDASHLKYRLLSEEMSRVVKPPTTHNKFFTYKADQVDAETHLNRFTFTLNETFAAVQLSSYRSSGNAVLKTAYDKVMTKLEANPKLQLSTFAGKRDPFELTKHSSSFQHVRALAVLRPPMHCAQPSTDRWRVSIFTG